MRWGTVLLRQQAGSSRLVFPTGWQSSIGHFIVQGRQGCGPLLQALAIAGEDAVVWRPACHARVQRQRQ